jgi:endogenous inhibitor of DNA gyrase (YacG/DUF329 family)
MLYCPECEKRFPHSEVTFESGVYASLGNKPDFPDGGLSLECPNCKKTSLYQRHQLVYAAN